MVGHGHSVEIGAGSAIGVIFGHFAKAYALGMVAAPAWFPFLIQGAVTLIVASLTVFITHFLKRWLNRRWPEPTGKRNSKNA